LKNHIAIKFIAVLLCAASLLGAVGSGMGVFLMTEMDLYDKTVDQVYAERVESLGRTFAQNTAMGYASQTLGGSPRAMLDDHFGYGDPLYNSGFDPLYFGYRLTDAEGTVLESYERTYGDSFTTYTFEVTGQYMHFLDSVTASERQAKEEAKAPMPLGNAEAVLFDAIPAEGAGVYEYQIATASSSFGGSGDSGDFVFRNQDGQVILRCPGLTIEPMVEDEVVTSVTLYGAGRALLFDAAWHSGIGMIRSDAEGGLTFLSYPMTAAEAAPAEEPVPVTIAPTETIPETEPEAETLPDETAAEAATEASAEEGTEESTEATAASHETAASEETAPAETAAEGEQIAEEGEASSDAEAAAYAEDSEAESAEDSTEATEAVTEPTIAETIPEETIPQETVPEETIPEPVLINGKPLESYQINRTEYYDSAIGEMVSARYVYLPMPEMTLELQIAPGALRSESSYTLMRIVQSISGYLFPAMGICLLIFAVCAVYLCCAAGHKPKSDEIRAGGLNRIPLDLYGFAVFGGVTGLCVAIAEGGNYVLRQNVNVGIAFMAAMGFLASLLIVGFLFACVAQFKTPGGFWWRNSLVGWGLKLCAWLFRKAMDLCVWLEEWLAAKGLPLLKRFSRWCWNLLKRSWLGICSGFNRVCSLLPLTWQWILAGGVMVLSLFITVAGRFDFGIVLAILFAFALILYGAHCFGALMDATRKMNKGNLNSKADDKLMVGVFKDFAHDLNDLADVAVVAAQKQLKSERMKTELITNVSHDIKTPLTSIINYVDLLRKAHTEEEQEQYLEVLDRQSQRLKKLIDDLIDMSKASTGNMAVDITLVDAVESVNQALGEFADKLDRAQLTPVFRHTEDTVAMMADGKLVWRVLSNLLSNAVKYAMPGTRLYIDLMSLENKVVISLKNISRDELNVDAEELMERFVRGDDSRNTEGSGLGLNIAKSLMELQKGQLQLLVDGDLFKVTLIFPGI